MIRPTAAVRRAVSGRRLRPHHPIASPSPLSTRISLQRQPSSRLLPHSFRPTESRPTRGYSSLAPARRIHPSASVPADRQSLYQTLSQLGDVAKPYINQGRLQLALRGLEDEPVTRVAVLSSRSALADARNLVQLLLADPLKPHEEWETVLQEAGERELTNVLFRYGRSVLPATRSQEHANIPLRTVLSDSRHLFDNRVELLFTGLGLDLSEAGVGGAESARMSDPVESMLVPMLETATSSTGNVTSFRYPVHRTIVVLGSLGELTRLSQLVRSAEGIDRSLIKVVIRMPGGGSNGSAGIQLVDLDTCVSALQDVRRSLSAALAFEKSWAGSGLAELRRWTVASGGSVLDLAESVLSQTERQLAAATSNRPSLSQARQVPLKDQLELETEISRWAERAHGQVQAAGWALAHPLSVVQRGSREEEAAAASRKSQFPEWRKLAWWRLGWRVDEVGSLLQSVLGRIFSATTEAEMVWLAGRIRQAIGIPLSRAGAGALASDGKTKESADKADQPPAHEATSGRRSDSWPLAIHRARTSLSGSTSTLTSHAHSLIAQTGVSLACSAALGLLSYLPSGLGLSLTESASVGGLTAVLALRRLQRGWEAGRERWRDEALARAKDAVRAQERELRLVLLERKKDPAEVEEAVREREAVERAIAEARSGMRR